MIIVFRDKSNSDESMETTFILRVMNVIVKNVRYRYQLVNLDAVRRNRELIN